MSELPFLPTLNATLNGLATVLLIAGFTAIRLHRRKLHKALMIAAFVTSTVFLISYLIYHYTQIHTVFQSGGWVRSMYYTMLFSHIVLAAAVVPLVLLSLYRALRADFERHRRIARWTLPIWLYVSVTGVLIYFMLYVFYPSAAA